MDKVMKDLETKTNETNKEKVNQKKQIDQLNMQIGDYRSKELSFKTKIDNLNDTIKRMNESK